MIVGLDCVLFLGYDHSKITNGVHYMSSYCLSPYQSKGNISLSCGKCENCRKKQSSEWAFRMKKEIEYWPESDVFPLFITLTYDDEHLPVNDGKVSLRHVDYTNFVKMIRQQLRRDYGKVIKLSIIGCGEYGDRSGRPHYHCVVHGIPITWRKGLPGIIKVIEEKWRFGFSYVKPCNGTVAGYVTKYSVKNLNKSRDCYRALGVEPPFRCYSQGIGLRYFECNQERIRREGFCRDGRFKVSIPRYFKDRFFSFQDYVRSRKEIFKRSVDLLRKRSLVGDEYVLDVDRLAYLSKYFDSIQRVIGRLNKQMFVWFSCSCGSSVVFRKYIYPVIESFSRQIKCLEGMLSRAFDEINRVRGYDLYRLLLYKLRDIERSLACQARDDLMSRGYFEKRLC